MTQQEKKIHLDIIKFTLVPLLTKLVSILGDGAIDWVKGLFDSGEVSAQGDGDGPGSCKPGFTWDGTKCVKDPG